MVGTVKDLPKNYAKCRQCGDYIHAPHFVALLATIMILPDEFDLINSSMTHTCLLCNEDENRDLTNFKVTSFGGLASHVMNFSTGRNTDYDV